MAVRNEIRGVFADIDDTLTTNGRLTAEAYVALERLHEAELLVVIITGRPDGVTISPVCGRSPRWWAKTAPFIFITTRTKG
ncbi:MAG: HAD hydrolase family protein [Sphingomonadales bacterium]